MISCTKAASLLSLEMPMAGHSVHSYSPSFVFANIEESARRACSRVSYSGDSSIFLASQPVWKTAAVQGSSADRRLPLRTRLVATLMNLSGRDV